MPTMDIATAHYLQPTVMTTPGSYQPLFTDLPRGIASLAQVAHGVLIHEHIAGAYGVTLTAERRGSVHVRPVAGLDAEVVEGRFEEWQPRPGERFDLVYAATAWHWIDPALRYQRAWQALRPGGHLAIWAAGHVFPEGGDPFFGEIQAVYDEIGEGLPPGSRQPRPGELADDRAGIEASGLFEVVAVRQYDWERVYDAEEYIELLSTFSGHIAMTGWQRERLFGEIRRRLARRPEHTVRRHWGAVLHVARRRDATG